MSDKKTHATEYRLSKAQQRTVTSLARERQQVVDEANRHVAEINEAIDHLAVLYAAEGNLPAGQFAFEPRDQGLALVSTPLVEEEEDDL